MKLQIDIHEGEFCVTVSGVPTAGVGPSLPAALANLEQQAGPWNFELAISPEAYERAHVTPGMTEQLELPL